MLTGCATSSDISLVSALSELVTEEDPSASPARARLNTAD
jgi:hypothetical protein